MDESGSSGVANNANDFLVVSLVLFPNKEAADKCSAAIDRLRERLKLKDTYEFHFSHNVPRYKEALVKLLPNLDFRFITVAIRKDATHRLASYSRVANLLQLADYVAALSFKRAKGAEKSIGMYRSIAKKQLAFLEISA